MIAMEQDNIYAGFTGDVVIFENPDEEPERGDSCSVHIIAGTVSSASTVGSIKNFREQIERLFPAPAGCRWSFYMLTALIVMDAK